MKKLVTNSWVHVYPDLISREVEEVVRDGLMLNWLWASKLFLFFMDSFVNMLRVSTK